VTECQCHAARREYQRLKEICEAIEKETAEESAVDDSENIVGFVVPSLSTLAGIDEDFDIFDDDDEAAKRKEPGIRLCITIESAPKISIDSTEDEIRRYAIDELRRQAAHLLAAADKIEAGGSSGKATAVEGGDSK